MTPARIRSDVVAERIAWIREMIGSIQKLPLSDYDTFVRDPRNPAAAESYLRRAIEALLDLGRHILSKGFGRAVAEYKDIGVKLSEEGVLSETHGTLFRKIAGYRNRMVHFYHEVSKQELCIIISNHSFSSKSHGTMPFMMRFLRQRILCSRGRSEIDRKFIRVHQFFIFSN